MKRLILMRHAKSDWSGDVDDAERPLNDRGQRSAVALGHWLRANDYLPDAVLCSTATRTRQTLAGLALPEDVPTRFTAELYLATHRAILEVMREAEGQTVLMLGHNPGLSITAAELVTAPPDHPQFDKYPTGATLVADLPVDRWAEAGWGSAMVRDFVVPREL